MIYEKILLKVVKILLEYEKNTTLKIIENTTLAFICPAMCKHMIERP